MIAVSLDQPAATLMVTRQPCDCPTGVIPGHDPAASHPMVKWTVTRPYPAPSSLIGQRVAIHATKRKPTTGEVGPHYVGESGDGSLFLDIGATGGMATTVPLPLGVIVGSGSLTASDLTDQLPYDDFTPGRHALLFSDLAPTTDRCPWCWGVGGVLEDSASLYGIPGGEDWTGCPVCRTKERCEPITWKSPGGRWPDWTP